MRVEIHKLQDQLAIAEHSPQCELTSSNALHFYFDLIQGHDLDFKDYDEDQNGIFIMNCVPSCPVLKIKIELVGETMDKNTLDENIVATHKENLLRKGKRHIKRPKGKHQCKGKVRYQREITAVRKAAKLNKGYYFCNNCKGYHLATRY